MVKIQKDIYIYIYIYIYVYIYIHIHTSLFITTLPVKVKNLRIAQIPINREPVE